jgi:hypothetical protein
MIRSCVVGPASACGRSGALVLWNKATGPSASVWRTATAWIGNVGTREKDIPATTTSAASVQSTTYS